MQKDAAMKLVYLITLLTLSFALISCVNTSPVMPCQTKVIKKSTKHKDPMKVSLYTQGSHPAQPFVVIGEENISKFNNGGIKRQEGNILDTMRTLAAEMGGDAVIDVDKGDKAISGKVIAYD